MSIHRPIRISTTDQDITMAVIDELLAAGIDETDAGTYAHNVVQRIMHPEKVSDITGFPEDDIEDTITPRRNLKRVWRIPGQGQ